MNPSFEKLEKTDIEQLIAAEVAESRTIEYKQSLPGGSDSDKKEFLADVSAFANSGGGRIFYGITERRTDGKSTGLPESAPGLDGFIEDHEVQRLVSILSTSISPRLQGVRFRTVQGFVKGPILCIDIPASFGAPHMISFKESSKFYYRIESGKQSMDVHQIRSAFIESQSLSNAIRDFRLERVRSIVAGEGSINVLRRPLIILHCIPASSIRDPGGLTIEHLRAASKDFGPVASRGWDDRINLEGLLKYDRTRQGEVTSYIQFYRSGAIEAVWSRDLGDESQPLVTVYFETRIVETLEQIQTFLQQAQVPAPFVFCLSLVGVRGLTIPAGNWFQDPSGHAVDRDILILPDAISENYEFAPEYILKPGFDSVYNAAGVERCTAYDQTGTWIKKRG